jgi:hypothetical protein
MELNNMDKDDLTEIYEKLLIAAKSDVERIKTEIKANKARDEAINSEIIGLQNKIILMEEILSKNKVRAAEAVALANNLLKKNKETV